MARRPKSRQVEQAERKGEKTPRIRGLGSRWNAVDADHRKWTLVITSRVGERCSPGPPEKGSAHLRSLGVLRDRRLRLRLVRRRLLAMQEANSDGGHELGLSRLANRWSGLAPNPLHPCEAQRTSISASSFGPTSSILNAVEMASLNSLTAVYSSTSAPPPPPPPPPPRPRSKTHCRRVLRRLFRHLCEIRRQVFQEHGLLVHD